MSKQFTSVQFQVVDIVSERTPNGYSMIYFKAIDGEINELMQIKIMNACVNDKICVRELMMERYFKELDKKKDNTKLKVGDVVWVN